jgi:hypothetical protein
MKIRLKDPKKVYQQIKGKTPSDTLLIALDTAESPIVEMDESMVSELIHLMSERIASLEGSRGITW